MIREIDPEVCIGCSLCAQFCPGDVIVMDQEGKARVAYPADCWTCFSCEMSCPVKAIDVHPFRKSKPMAWRDRNPLSLRGGSVRAWRPRGGGGQKVVPFCGEVS